MLQTSQVESTAIHEVSQGVHEKRMTEEKIMQYLLHLIFISGISSWNIIRQRLWACELMIGRWSHNEVSLTSNLAGKSCNRARHYERMGLA
jgi:hypothetical protein